MLYGSYAPAASGYAPAMLHDGYTAAGQPSAAGSSAYRAAGHTAAGYASSRDAPAADSRLCLPHCL